MNSYLYTINFILTKRGVYCITAQIIFHFAGELVDAFVTGLNS